MLPAYAKLWNELWTCKQLDAVLRDLTEGLAPSAAFWDDHNYFEPETPFFSYLYDVVRQ